MAASLENYAAPLREMRRAEEAEELEPLPGSSRFTLTMPVVDFLIAETVAGHCHVNWICSEIGVTRRLSKCSISMA